MILVVAEQQDGRLNRASFEAVAAAQQIGGPVTIVLVGHGMASLAAELATADVAGVTSLEHEALAQYTPDGYVAALAAYVNTTNPSHVVFAHTYQTRDFAPRLAARLDRALVTDGTAIKRHGDQVLVTRPMFQGKVHADVVFEGPAPHCITIQIGAFRPEAVRPATSAVPVQTVAASLSASDIHQQPEAPFREAKLAVDLTQAERIVSVGRGIKDQEHIAIAQQLATALGAELAASRPICDSGWLPMDRQIGSSGQTVAPKLYLALGISGAIQHIVGMKGAKTIVAINKDADAPIFEVADYGIVGDLFEVVPAMIAALK
ncbi:MAG: electron transfer flavoprotein subunit alpha/FixB family protein [Acidobacteriota bacterium]